MKKVYLVPAIKRVFDVFELLNKNEGGLTLSRIHRDLGLPLSSAATILYTLESLGYVERVGDDSRYVMSMKLTRFVPRLEKRVIVDRCNSLLAAMVSEVGLTGHFAVPRDGDSVYIDRVQSTGLVQVNSFVGMTWPLYSSGVGKAMLAFMDPQMLSEKMKILSLKKLTERTVASKRALERQLAEFRSLGYSFEIEEDILGVGCVAAPVFGASRVLVGGISVAGTTQQISKETIPEIGKVVRRYAGLISAKLGADL